MDWNLKNLTGKSVLWSQRQVLSHIKTDNITHKISNWSSRSEEWQWPTHEELRRAKYQFNKNQFIIAWFENDKLNPKLISLKNIFRRGKYFQLRLPLHKYVINQYTSSSAMRFIFLMNNIFVTLILMMIT